MKTKSKMKVTYKKEIQINPYSNVWACCCGAEANESNNGYKLKELFNSRLNPVLHSLTIGTIHHLQFSDS